MKNYLIFKLLPLITILLIGFSINSNAQVRIGHNATQLESPNHSLLELANSPDNNLGKGLLLPRVTQAQMEVMETSTNVPNGMLVFNTTREALMIKQGGIFLAFTSTINFVPTTFTQDAVYYNGINNIFTLDKTPIQKGAVQITYNHIPLTQNIDFSVNGATVTFLTIVPDNKNNLGTIMVQK